MFAATSCNGNGGSLDSEGETYSSAGGQASVSSGSGLVAGGGITGAGILAASNGGDGGTILSGVAADSQTASASGTTTVALSASAIGLPSGGSVSLTISGGGISYASESSASSDGNVYFTVPAIASGTTVTVSIVVKAADGSVSCYGSKTQTVTDGASLVDVTLTDGTGTDGGTAGAGGEWSLPSALTVSGSLIPLYYDPTGTLNPDVTFTVANILTTPSEGTLTYTWTNSQTGAVISGAAGKTLTIRLGDLMGSTTDAGQKGVSVTATYTDADGNVSTATGSASVTVFSYQMPEFTISVTPAPGVTANSDGSYSVTNLSSTVLTFTASPASGSSFLMGTTFAWKVNGTAVPTATTASFGFVPSIVDISSLSATATSVSVECTATYLPATNSPQTASKTVTLVKPTLPTPVASVTCTGTAVTGSANTWYVNDNSNLGSTSLSFSVSNAASMPAGTQVVWYADGSAVGGTTGTAVSTAVPVTLGTVKSSFPSGSSSMQISVYCVVKKDGYDDVQGTPITITVQKKPTSIPDFTVMIDNYPGENVTGSYCKVNASSSAGVRALASSGSLPQNDSGATFTWKANENIINTTSSSETSFTVSQLLSAIDKSTSDLHAYNGNESVGQGIVIRLSCTISYPDAMGIAEKSSTVSSGNNDLLTLFSD